MNRKELIKKYNKSKFTGVDLTQKQIAYNYAIDDIVAMLKSQMTNDMVEVLIGTIYHSIKIEIKECDQTLVRLLGKGRAYEELVNDFIKLKGAKNDQIKS